MRTTFTASSIDQLREKAAKAAMAPGGLPSGWIKSPVDPMNLVSVFEPLRIKSGYVLRAYQFVAGNNGNGFVWAMPVDAEFPDPEDCPRVEGVFLEPPKPAAALDNVMDAIEGDGSPWSYMCASILMRELAEFGAMWHGCSWSEHRVLDKSPWSREDDQGQESAAERTASPAEMWEWLETQPDDWRPLMERKRQRVHVMFLTLSGLGREAIYRHVDSYKVGSYQPKTSRQEIVRGAGGYVF